MAGSNKPTAVHYSLVVFVMLTIIFGLTTYMYLGSFSDAQAQKQKAEADLAAEKRLSKNQDDDIQALKKLLGYMLETVEDRQNPANPNTVVGATRVALQNYGKEQSGATVEDTLKTMREALDTTLADRNTIKTTLDTTNAELLALRTRYTATADEHDNAKTKAETDLRTVTNTQDEKLNQKDTAMAQLRQEYNTIQTTLAEERDGREKERAKLQAEVNRLEAINDVIRGQLEEVVERVSFEVEDGRLVRVDNSSKTVWINLGEADFLRPRMTFSVYAKETPGIGRGSEDVKGRIEVTRVHGANMAEARIIDEDLYRPMAPGDLIYTPLWSPGRVEKFSFVGLIDLDGDGRTDRDQLHNIVNASGAKIDNEVDDVGEWMTGDSRKEGAAQGKIDEQTKFLVIGEIPDPSQMVGDEKIQQATDINTKLTDLQRQARQFGVRIVTLNDFLSFVGYKARRRLFLPGQQKPYNLRAGAASSTTNEPLGGRESTGNVSGSFSRNKALPPASSTGNTSKVFGGNN